MINRSEVTSDAKVSRELAYLSGPKVMGSYRNGVEGKQDKIPLKSSEIFDTRNSNQIFDIILIAKI